jgi:hypothetical protein
LIFQENLILVSSLKYYYFLMQNDFHTHEKSCRFMEHENIVKLEWLHIFKQKSTNIYIQHYRNKALV